MQNPRFEISHQRFDCYADSLRNILMATVPIVKKH